MADITCPLQKVLIVDDLASNRLTLSEILHQDQVQVIPASSGKEALKILSKQDVSLIITDVMMPEMDGYELASQIHSAPATRFTPIIFATGSECTEEELSKGYHSGVVDILYKPLKADILRAKVKIFLDLDKQRRLVREQSADLRDAIKRLQYYAQHDQLTQLLNREQLINVLTRLMANARRTNKLVGLLFIDLDHFKEVNDSLGHDAGDILLKSVAERIKNVVREGDFVARLGGDEFAVVLNGLSSPSDGGDVASKILEQLSLAHVIHNKQVYVSCSIGIALYDNHSRSASDLLKSADTAMYQAKRKGRNRYSFYSAELESQAQQKSDVARGLAKALHDNSFQLHFQPQLSIDGRSVVGFEALLRWFDTTDFVSPTEFIPVAEDCGLIADIGNWVIEQSCKELKNWINLGIVDPKTKISVNISLRQFLDKHFSKHLERILNETEVPPGNLEIEVSESSLMADPEKSKKALETIQSTGVDIAIDDFGTSASSLSLLRSLPLDIIKIDQRFIQDLTRSEHDEAIVKAIIALSHCLGFKVVAEGVETDAQKDFLKKNACNYAQGFLFASPIPAYQVSSYMLSIEQNPGF